jgi:replication factor A1
MFIISEIKNHQNPVDVKGKISEKSSIGNIIGKDGQSQKQAIAKLCDGSGQIQITLWRDDAERITDGDNIELKNGYCNIIQNTLNITAGYYGKITIIDENISCLTQNLENLIFKKINQIKENDKGISVDGAIKDKTPVGSILGKDGQSEKQAFCKLFDETGEIWMTLWNDDAEKFQNNDAVHLKNAYVVHSSRGLNLTVGYFGKIIKKDDDDSKKTIFDPDKTGEL